MKGCKPTMILKEICGELDVRNRIISTIFNQIYVNVVNSNKKEK